MPLPLAIGVAEHEAKYNMLIVSDIGKYRFILIEKRRIQDSTVVSSSNSFVFEATSYVLIQFFHNPPPAGAKQLRFLMFFITPGICFQGQKTICALL